MKIIISTVIVILVVWGVWLIVKNQSNKTNTIQSTLSEQKSKENSPKLKIEILKEGSGPKAKEGDLVKVDYTGTLTDGTKFDSSIDRGQPFEFTLGSGMVIKGWDQGVVEMKVGEKRRLTIPSELGYGDKGFPPTIPGKSTLIFEIDLLKIN